MSCLPGFFKPAAWLPRKAHHIHIVDSFNIFKKMVKNIIFWLTCKHTFYIKTMFIDFNVILNKTDQRTVDMDMDQPVF